MMANTKRISPLASGKRNTDDELTIGHIISQLIRVPTHAPYSILASLLAFALTDQTPTTPIPQSLFNNETQHRYAKRKRKRKKR
jgi:hypothetical protein